jgi:hypothetical protein
MGKNETRTVPHRHSSWNWKDRPLRLRLALTYILVPLSAPLCMVLLMIRGERAMSLGDWGGIVLLYTFFGFAAMIVFGTPLIYVYSRLNWTGFFAFIAGGAVCAALTYTLVMRGHITSQFPFFTMFGVVEGFVLRLILFVEPRCANDPCESRAHSKELPKTTVTNIEIHNSRNHPKKVMPLNSFC